MPATVYAICNQKGGVGKTTTVYHLAAAIAETGRTALCVDLDPQGNMTTVLGKDDLKHDDLGIAEVLSSRTDVTIDDVVMPSLFTGVDVVPTPPESEKLAVVRDELVVTGAGREKQLSDALEPFKGKYDFILLDFPPTIDLLTINGMSAADYALIGSRGTEPPDPALRNSRGY